MSAEEYGSVEFRLSEVEDNDLRHVEVRPTPS